MDVFISYAQPDAKIAEKVAEGLRRSGLRVRDYRRNLLPGDLWADKASQALRESDAMVVLVTPNAAAQSDQIRSEINYALSSVAFENRLIPVVVGPPERIPKQEFPWILWELQIITLPERGNQEPGIRQIAQTLLKAA
jgi:TIR domain